MSVSSQHNPLILKLVYVVITVILAVNWPPFSWLPTWLLTQLSVLWIMCLYRPMFKNKSRSIVGQFIVGFCIRMGWTALYNLYNTGSIHGDQQWDFGLLLLETFIACAIYTALPVSWLERLWSNQYARWSIFVFDQAMANGLKFLPLFTNQFLMKQHSTILIPITVLSCRAILRPSIQIISAYLSNNLNKNNLRKWLMIAYRNVIRALALALINYIVLKYYADRTKDRTHIIDQLQFFNLCYYGFVGYLMYLETYST